MSAPPGWDDILAPGERILWQGRPDRAWVIGPANIAVALFGAAFGGFALVWMSLVAQGGTLLWTFGLLHFAVGALIILAGLVWPTVQRRHSWYALSTERAFIATDLPLLGRQLDSYPITPDSRLHLIDGSPGSVTFHTLATTFTGTDTRTMQMHGKPGIPTNAPSGPRRRRRTRSTRIGFERIPDARRVYALMAQIQKGTP